MPVETWYVMEDGTVGDPRDISPGADGRLRHKDGRAVEYRPHGPRSRGGIDADAERAKAGKKAEAPPRVEAKEMKAEEPKRGYKTREAKAD